MMKRTLWPLLVLVYLAGPLQAQLKWYQDWGYLSSGSGVMLAAYSGAGGVVSAPDMIEGLPVVDISGQLFNRTQLTSISLPPTITNIGSFTFRGGCSNLTNVTMPDSLVTVGFQAFSGCTDLTNIIIPASVVSIGKEAFSHSGLTSITLPKTLSDLGRATFLACHDLKEILVDHDNPYFSSLDGVLFDKNQTTLIQYPAGKVGHYSIPQTVTSIGDWAFCGCTNLTGIAIPNGVARLGEKAFNGCTNLTRVAIPKSVTSIGVWAFGDCSSLTNLMLASGVVTIRTNAFLWCTGLTEVAIPGSVTSIEDAAFGHCNGVTNLTIDNGVVRIGASTFAGCSGLTDVTIPSSVTNLGLYAFSSCTNLTNVYFEGDAPGVGWNSFSYVNNATVYYLPGSTGWGASFATVPTKPWLLPEPIILTHSSSFGMLTNKYGFIVSWATNLSVVVEATTNLTSPLWVPLLTTNLSAGSLSFADAQWTNSPARFYRVRSP